MKLNRVIPALPVRQIEPAAAFYHTRIGCAVGYQDERFAIVTRDQVEIHLWAARDESWEARAGDRPGSPVVTGAESFLAGTASCRVEVSGIDALYDECKRNGILYGPDTVVEVRPWGMREFPVLDLDRNLITFFEPV
ncbi:MAG: bleomycin resistance family protein [Gemmatimonadetes bacterium]|nr:bleomycin resistance family protein [Pseudomonadales bacterium]NIW37137.1 bleomycin resistance family protein [Gemmatimonadota bacterium]NIX08115.1 bleomycin resistance family protein [Pseudomonadales bacterium]